MRIDFHLFSLFLLFLIRSSYIYAQDANIQGKITDKKGEPILAANVYLKKEPDKGTISDINGYFILRCQSHSFNNDTLIISFLGLKTKIIPTVHLDTSKEISIVMEEDQQMLVEVVIMANPSLSREFSIKEVSKFDIYNTPSSAGDALKMVTVLPASTNVSESANVELRGSAGDMSRVMLNEVPVYKPVRNSQINGIGNFSLFNTEMIEEQNVYASNPPLVYSNATAGLVEIGTIKKLSASETALSLSLANIGFLHSQSINKKSFLQIYGNYQFSKPYLWVNANNKDINKFSSEDTGLNFHTELTKRLSINLYSYFINEKYLANDYSYTFSGTVDAGKRRNFNILNFKYKLGKGFISINNGTDFSNEDFKFGNILSKQKNCYVYSNFDFKYYFTPSWNLQSGFSHEYTKQNYRSRFPKYYFAVKPENPSYYFENSISNNNLEFYLYNRVQIFNELTLGVGIRKNIPVKEQSGYWSYQTNIKYSFNNYNSILASLGKYNGYATPYYNTQEFSSISTRQYSLEYSFSRNDFNLRLATYHKKENLKENFSETDTSERLLRKIWGAEISMSKKYENLTGSLAYTYLYSKFRNGGKWYNSYNRMDYLIKAFISYYHKKAGTVSLSCLTRPGLYYSPIINAEINETGAYKPLYGDYNVKQYSGYCSVDFSYNKVLTLKSSNLIFFLTVNNIFDIKNESAIMFSEDYSTITGYRHYNRRSIYTGMQLRF